MKDNVIDINEYKNRPEILKELEEKESLLTEAFKKKRGDLLDLIHSAGNILTLQIDDDRFLFTFDDDEHDSYKKIEIRVDEHGHLQTKVTYESEL